MFPETDEREDKMANSEKVLGFRFDEDVLRKLDYLMKEDAKESDRLGVRPRTRKEFFEEGIRELYMKLMKKTQDADVVDRISETVHDEVNTSMNNLHKKIDEILYLSIKNDLGNKVLYRSPSVLPPPKSVEQAIRIIIDERSGWNDALDEYLQMHWKDKTDGGDEE